MSACWLSSSTRAVPILARAIARPLAMAPRALTFAAVLVAALGVVTQAGARVRSSDTTAVVRIDGDDHDVTVSKRGGVTVTVDGDGSGSRPDRVVMIGPHISVDDDGEVAIVRHAFKAPRRADAF